MNKNSIILLAGALVLLMLAAACGSREDLPPIVIQTSTGTVTETPQALETESASTVPTQITATAESAGAVPATPITRIPGIPVTGADINLLDEQFCIDNLAHALLVFPETATFELVAPSATGAISGFVPACTTIETYNGRQVVLCRAEENTPMILNVCSIANRCTELQVDLQTCPDVQPILQITRPAAAPTKQRDEPINATPVPPTVAPPANPTTVPPVEPINTPVVEPTQPLIENPTEPPPVISTTLP